MLLCPEMAQLARLVGCEGEWLQQQLQCTVEARAAAFYDALVEHLQAHRFDTMSAALAQRGDSWRTKLPAYRASELLG